MISRRHSSLRAIALAVALGASLGLAAGTGSASAALAGAQQDAPQQEVQSWALSPAGTSSDPNQPNNRSELSYELDPGAVVEDAVTLFNYGNVQLNFEVYATDAFNNDTGQFDLLPGDQPPDDVGSWITLPTRVITVAAGMQVTLPITVRVPDDAKPGDHAGAVVAASKALGTGPDGKTVTVDRRTGSRVYIRVGGPVHPELAIEDVNTTYEPSINPLGGTAKVSYTIRNRGNVRLGGSHHVDVSGPFGLFGKGSKAQDLPELLPGEAVTIHESFSGVPALVLERTKVHLDPAPTDLPASSRGGTALAPPLTLIFLALATWLALRSRRAYRRHREDGAPPPPAAPQPEPKVGQPA